MISPLDCALHLLRRREHSAYELAEKLKQKGYEKQDIENVLLQCQQRGLQSDARFVESLSRVRTAQGYGPLRIKQELQSKKISQDLIEAFFCLDTTDWRACTLEVIRKKFKNRTDVTYDEREKQKRFLLYRGFSMDTIESVFNDN